MTYNVFGGTLNLTQPLLWRLIRVPRAVGLFVRFCWSISWPDVAENNRN